VRPRSRALTSNQVRFELSKSFFLVSFTSRDNCGGAVESTYHINLIGFQYLCIKLSTTRMVHTIIMMPKQIKTLLITKLAQPRIRLKSGATVFTQNSLKTI
jgi:hypothetical protein